MQSRIEVLMMADLVEYSRIMDESPDRALQAVRELKTTYLEPVADQHGGEVLKRMGDGWIFSYPSATSAVNCAMGVQTALSAHETIKLRMGAHVGEIVREDDDFYGPGANIAQRVQAEAPPGGLMISQDFHRQLPGELSSRFKDAGSFKLKNISAPHVLFQWRPSESSEARAEDLPTIAVEPFEFAPDDAETRVAAGDLRDQLLERLSRRTGIRVIDDHAGKRPTSAYQLRGRLRLSPTRGRLQLSMMQPHGDGAVWSESYDGDPSDIFAFCDDLVDRSDASLRLQINAFDGDRIAALPDDRLSVSELRSRAASSFYRVTLKDWQHAQDLMDRALRLKPDDAMSLAMRVEAVVHIAASGHNTIDEEEKLRLQKDVDAAIEASPRSDYFFWTRALLRVQVLRQPERALEDLQRTLKLSPAYAPAHECVGLCHMLMGDFEAAVKHLERAVELSEADPLWPQRVFLQTIAKLGAGEPEDAAATIAKAIQIRPNEQAFHLLQAECYRRAGEELAADAVQRSLSNPSHEPTILAPRPQLPRNFAWIDDALLRLS